MPTLLVVDDEPNILTCFRRAFRSDDLRVVTAETVEEGLRLAEAERPDVTVLDLSLPDGCGLDLFRRLRERDPKCHVLFITAHGSTDTVIQAMKEGAYDYLLKPLELADVRAAVEGALRVRRFMHVPATFAPPAGIDADLIVGRSAAMQEVYKAIGRAAPQSINILILGESGTGKELVARAIYHHSRRGDRPFLAVNCAAIPEPLLESEMFGHEQGAFTGADRRRIGKFEQCNGGTLFLDEIGDLSLPTQAKLLRVMQDRTFQRLGGNDTMQVDVRVIAATHQNLEAMVAEGTFRADLYFRLADFTVNLPPLRERRDDMEELVLHLLGQLNRELETEVHTVSDEALKLLAAYDWPGNVRELQSALRSALLHASGSILLPQFLRRHFGGDRRGQQAVGESIPPERDDDFRRLFLALLDQGEPDLHQAMTDRLDRLMLEILMDKTGGEPDANQPHPGNHSQHSAGEVAGGRPAPAAVM